MANIDVFLRSGDATPSNVVIYPDVPTSVTVTRPSTDVYVITENAPVITRLPGSQDVKLYTYTPSDTILQQDIGIAPRISIALAVILRVSGPIGAPPDHYVYGVGGIAEAVVFGLPIVGDVGIAGVGKISQAVILGQPALSAQVNVAGIAQATAFGGPILSAIISLSGFVETVALGQPLVGSVTIFLAGIAEVAALGLPIVGLTGITGVGSIVITVLLGQPFIDSAIPFVPLPFDTTDEYGNLFAQRPAIKTPVAVDIKLGLGDDYGRQ